VEAEQHDLYGVSCPSISLCVAVDSAGNVVTSTDPTGAAGAWTTTCRFCRNQCHLVPHDLLVRCGDDEGNVVTSADPTGGAGAWTVIGLEGTDWLTGVSCPSPSLCVAVDTTGHVVTSTDPAGGSADWTTTEVGLGNYPNGVSCPTVTLCVAVDSYGNVLTSTDPTGESERGSSPTSTGRRIWSE
jgi:hypothetical protein